MVCLHPSRIRVKGKPYGSPGSVLEVPCGRCLPCRIEKTREWKVRLLHELDAHESAVFVTLTYDPDHLPEDLSVSKRELQLYIKRVRFALEPRKIKYFGCGEYGEQYGRPHYHIIMFSVGFEDAGLLRSCWDKGFVSVGTVTADSCGYVAGYVRKKLTGPMADEVYNGRLPPFQLQSQGLGKDYALSHRKQIEADLGTSIRGVPQGLPRYYRKVLEIPTEALAEKAIESASKVADVWFDRGAKDDADVHVAKHYARKQNARTLADGLSLKESKL